MVLLEILGNNPSAIFIRFCNFLAIPVLTYDRVTVIGSDLFGQEDYIKRYLEDPDLPFITVIKIGLRYYITGDLILQLDELKNHLKVPSFKDSPSGILELPNDPCGERTFCGSWWHIVIRLSTEIALGLPLSTV